MPRQKPTPEAIEAAKRLRALGNSWETIRGFLWTSHAIDVAVPTLRGWVKRK